MEANSHAHRCSPRAVAEWTKLVVSTGREREPGQIERLLGDLGPMPEAESPDDRALYVAALIK